MLWAVTARLYPLNCLGFDSCWAKQCLGRVLRARGSPLQMDSTSWGPHMLYSTLCLPIRPLWQHKCSVHGENFWGEKIIYKSWWFPSIILCRSQGRGLYERREGDELLWRRSGSVLSSEYPKYSNGFVQFVVLQHWRKGKMLSRDFRLTINWKSNNRRKS